MPFKLKEIADHIDAQLQGDPDCLIDSVASLHNASKGALSFLSNRRYCSHLKNTQASAVIISAADAVNCPVNKLITPEPYLAYARAAQYLFPDAPVNTGTHPSAVVSSSARVDKSVCIGANVYIGERVCIAVNSYIGPGTIILNDVIIGEGCYLTGNISICEGTHIGAHTRLHPGVVIGADGFGIAKDDDKWLKVPQRGNVVIGEDVEIGANTTIDRGALDNTIINNGVKIDNQVQIGHNVVIGENTAIAGCCAIAGSVKIGQRCMIGGQSAISGHIEIADDVIITGMSGVSNSIKQAGMYSSGIAVTETKVWRKNMIRFKQLDDIARRLKKLEDKNADD
jgi:UDP-3-O-[3-hydroxymyristoyl] glucosamine N-acyltransferase